jgi:hypothetical protein
MVVANKNANKGVGRPTAFEPEYSKQAAALCSLGAIDRAIADFFSVSEATLSARKKAHPEFLESLNDGKAEADALDERNLYSRTAPARCRTDAATRRTS